MTPTEQQEAFRNLVREGLRLARPDIAEFFGRITQLPARTPGHHVSVEVICHEFHHGLLISADIASDAEHSATSAYGVLKHANAVFDDPRTTFDWEAIRTLWGAGIPPLDHPLLGVDLFTDVYTPFFLDFSEGFDFGALHIPIWLSQHDDIGDPIPLFTPPKPQRRGWRRLFEQR